MSEMFYFGSRAEQLLHAEVGLVWRSLFDVYARYSFVRSRRASSPRCPIRPRIVCLASMQYCTHSAPTFCRTPLPAPAGLILRHVKQNSTPSRRSFWPETTGSSNRPLDQKQKTMSSSLLTGLALS